MITSRSTRSGCSTASRSPIGPPQSCTTNVAPRMSRSSSSVAATATWRSYEYQPMSIGLSERPKPARSGQHRRGGPRRARGGATLRHRKPHVGSPCHITTGRAVALVDVGQAQAVDLPVARLPFEAGEALEQLVGRADRVGHGASMFTRSSSGSSDFGVARHGDVDRVRLAHPGDQVQRPQPVEHELERQRLRGARVAARDVERPARGVQREVARRLAVALDELRWYAPSRTVEVTISGDCAADRARTCGADVERHRQRLGPQPAVQRRGWCRRRANSPMRGSRRRPVTASSRGNGTSCRRPTRLLDRRGWRTPACGRAGAAPPRRRPSPVCSDASRAARRGRRGRGA